MVIARLGDDVAEARMNQWGELEKEDRRGMRAGEKEGGGVTMAKKRNPGGRKPSGWMIRVLWQY